MKRVTWLLHRISASFRWEFSFIRLDILKSWKCIKALNSRHPSKLCYLFGHLMIHGFVWVWVTSVSLLFCLFRLFRYIHWPVFASHRYIGISICCPLCANIKTLLYTKHNAEKDARSHLKLLNSQWSLMLSCKISCLQFISLSQVTALKGPLPKMCEYRPIFLTNIGIGHKNCIAGGLYFSSI